jgi:proteasome lid subunit RPN8/RPN11
MVLSDQARTAIESHALQCYPNEACGLIVDDNYIACANVAEDTARGFAIAGEEYARAEDRGVIQAIVHSHPDASGLPSIADLLACEASRVDFWIIVSVGRGSNDQPAIGRLHVFGRTAKDPPLIGATFVHGTHDCYGLVPGLLSFSRHGNESVEVECIPKHGDGHVDNVA